MPRSAIRTFLLSAVATLAFAAPAAADCEGADVRPVAGNAFALSQTTVCLLNEQRAANGLGPLSQNALLAVAASGHNRNMIVQSFFDHTGRDGSTIQDRIGATGYLIANAAWTIGENLAWGTGSLGSPRAIVSSWMKSDGHRRNILNTDFLEIGIAVDFGVPDRALLALPGATYTTEFGTVAPPPPPAAAEPAPARPASVRRPHAKPKAKKVVCKTRKQKRTRACKRRTRRR